MYIKENPLGSYCCHPGKDDDVLTGIVGMDVEKSRDILDLF